MRIGLTKVLITLLFKSLYKLLLHHHHHWKRPCYKFISFLLSLTENVGFILIMHSYYHTNEVHTCLLCYILSLISLLFTAVSCVVSLASSLLILSV